VLGAGGMLDDFVKLGIDDQTRALIGPLPTGHGPLGVPVEELGPLRLPEPLRHGASVGFPPQHPPTRSLLAVPIRAAARVYGGCT